MRETPAGIVCRLHTFPWFISSYTCSVIELNCRRIGTDGNAKDLEKVLTLVKHDLIFYVAFTHCPALEIPSTIQEFRNLKGIEVYNSTIVDWPEQASLQQDLHPYLSVLYMARVNMSELPTGLQHPQFPRSLMDIEMCMVNLTTLPEVIIGRWPRRLTFLYWEMSGLRQIPSVVGELQVDQLSFSGNDIREVPDVIFASQHLQVVSFAANRELAVIPSDMGDISLLYEVLLDYTSVAALPTWLTPSFASSLGTNVSASATPFCGQQFEDIGGVHCALLQYDTISLYPIEIKDAQRST
ncbi:TPA: hypothetical protein N0F65_006315 [Lagenidium giganteum]|uniref:Uncharacterized protein n=1 Tax=Lagenidium giganteum TaxID=4803 RepID=A0AAV2YN77_9STRA|nr:TPA: hypothetical protein N0F65_006315 [Lagenidium giganteum]